MPELPEVQTTVHGLNTRIRGLIIADVWTDYNSAFHIGKDSIKDPAYFRHFKKEVLGAKIIRVTRRAKNILIHISTPIHTSTSKKPTKSTESSLKKIILVHMKMTGHFLYDDYDHTDPLNRFIHFIITFTNGKTLELSDMRKFAKVTLVSDSDLEQSLHLAHIGPEPLEKDFTFSIFKDRLNTKPNGRIKTVLMDQSVIAGIGNIYSDEALWRAGIHPEERVKSVFRHDAKSGKHGRGDGRGDRDTSDHLLKKLYVAILTVLKKGIDFGGDSMSDYRNIDGKPGTFQEQHRAYRKTGTKCTLSVHGHLCHGIIIRKVVGGRSAHFCSVHQCLLKNR